MNVHAWHLPWKGATVPHAALDIIRGCNITCEACYNSRPEHIKTLTEIEADLDTLLAHRKLDSVLLVGGEVLLHPQLADIVKRTKARGLVVELITNGVLLNPQLLSDLRDSGLSLIFLHIDRGQQRPDLPPNATHEQLLDLWEEKTALVARHGIDVGLNMTAFEERIADIKEMFDFTMGSELVNYMLVTLFRDSARLTDCRGDLASGLHGARLAPNAPKKDTLTNSHIQRYLREELGLSPFCYLGSNLCPDDPRWLSYLVARHKNQAGNVFRHCLRVSAFEKAYLALALRLAGRYPMYRRQNPRQLLAQLIINGLAGGDLPGNVRFLTRCISSGSKIATKRLLFQCPADVTEDGTVVHCFACPDAVAQNGNLVPVCISDKIRSCA